MTDAPKPVDIVVSLLAKTHQIKVVWRPDLETTVSPTGLEGSRWLHDGRGWTLPALQAYTLLPYFHTNFPQYRISFDTDSAKLIQSQLEKEAVTAVLATAEDGDVPDVLSVSLRPFQRATIAYLLRGMPRKIVALDTGLGKTAVAAAYARIRQSRTLWITKEALAINLTREIKKLTGQKALQLVGSQPTAEKLAILEDKSTQHIIMTYGQFSRSGIVGDEDENAKTHSLWVFALKLAPFDLLVIDEAHNIKNRNSLRYRVISQLGFIPSILFLTATPLVNNGLDLYSLLHILEPKTFGSPMEFIRAYLSDNGRQIRNPKRMQEDLLPYMFRRKKGDVLKDLPAKIRQQHNIELTPEWRARYNDILAGIYTDLQGNEIDVPDMILAKINRFRQVVSQAKVEHTTEYARTLEEEGNKCLIFTAWKETAYALGKELYCDVITGDVEQQVRMEMQDKFNNRDDVKHLVLTLDVGREGLNLTGANAIVFNDYGWNPMVHDQAEGRAWGRLNDPHGCLVYYVAVDNSIDSFMMSTLQYKQEMIDKGIDGTVAMAKDQVSMTSEFIKYLKQNRM